MPCRMVAFLPGSWAASGSHTSDGLTANLAIENPPQEFSAEPLAFTRLLLRMSGESSRSARKQAALMSDHVRRSCRRADPGQVRAQE